VLRHAAGGTINDNVTVNIADFAYVHALVGRVAARAPDGHSDPLASAMVWRGNLYSEMRADRLKAPKMTVRIDESPAGSVTEASEEITRLELVDLGDVKSRVVREIIEYLAAEYTDDTTEQSEAGLKPTTRRGWLIVIGLVRELPDGWQWPEEDVVETIRRLLVKWTPKLVRTRFHPLRVAGVITGERKFGNAPWVYRLPESFTPAAAFSWLPSPEEVRRTVEVPENLPDTGLPELPRLSFVGPASRANQSNYDTNS
jgi:hypothetical protein